MSRTARLSLPLVMPAQAQKHVTVNQALAMLDAVVQLSVVSSNLTVPPSAAAEGDSFIVPGGASGAWLGKTGAVAVWSNGGWMFLSPRAGWRAWDAARSAWQIHDGTSWVAEALAVSPGGACLRASILEFDHAVTPGGSNPTSIAIPAGVQVLGVSGRVTSALTGTGLSSWRVGVAGSSDRYGSGLGLGRNSYVAGLTGTPVTYYSDTPLLLTAEGGSFGSGAVRLAVHLVRIEPPRMV